MSDMNRRQFIAAGVGAATLVRYAFSAPADDELTLLSLKQASDMIRAKKVSPVELTEACLARIGTYNPKINAFIAIGNANAKPATKPTPLPGGQFASSVNAKSAPSGVNHRAATTKTAFSLPLMARPDPDAQARRVRRIR